MYTRVVSQPRTPAPGRVAAAKRASAARTRAKHQRWAAELATAGYVVIPPGQLDDIEIHGEDGSIILNHDVWKTSCTFWPDCNYPNYTPLVKLVADAIGHTCKDADGKGITRVNPVTGEAYQRYDEVIVDAPRGAS